MSAYAADETRFSVSGAPDHPPPPIVPHRIRVTKVRTPTGAHPIRTSRRILRAVPAQDRDHHPTLEDTVVVCRLPSGYTSGRLLRWHQAPGSHVSVGQPLADVGLGSETVPVLAPMDGYVYRQLVVEDAVVWNGDYVAFMTDCPNRPPGLATQVRAVGVSSPCPSHPTDRHLLQPPSQLTTTYI
jgi:hypothetical protein